jgi:hypothetical protein
MKTRLLSAILAGGILAFGAGVAIAQYGPPPPPSGGSTGVYRNNPQTGGHAQFTVKLYMEGGKPFVGPCSAIHVEADPAGAPSVIEAASGPDNAPSGGCSAVMKGLPSGVDVTLSASGPGLQSKPDTAHGPPSGKWDNPLTLAVGFNPIRFLTMYPG